MAGTGRAAELGVLFKGGEVFERARDVDVVLLDKTGTVTEGRMTLAEDVPFGPDIGRDEVLVLAAAVEAGSEHPIARAIVDGARGFVIPDAGAFRAMPGAGRPARRWPVTRSGSDGPPTCLTNSPRSSIGLSAEGATVVAVWRDGSPVGVDRGERPGQGRSRRRRGTHGGTGPRRRHGDRAIDAQRPR